MSSVASVSDETVRVPIVAVVGRPNVGKSTLVNRIVGRRQAIVEDVPGVTRDRVSYEVTWSGRRFTIVDTGGWQPGAGGLSARVTAQAELAVAAADLVLFVVDATVGITETDAAVAKFLRRSDKPVLLVANKVDNAAGELDTGELWSLGLGQPYTVSALHGRGSGDLLDAVITALPSSGAGGEPDTAPDALRRVAIVGRPNVGKSSLLNRLAGEERALVDAVSGTTRDPVDAIVRIGDRRWRVVDTAGLRRRMRDAVGAEFYAGLRTDQAIRDAEAAVVLLDAAEPITEQDVRIVQKVIDAGRALVLAFNKWDAVDADRRLALAREIETELGHVGWAPRLNISARTGRGVEKLAAAMETALTGWEQRVPTARLNAWLSELVAARPHPVRGGRQPRPLFATQASTRPPRIVLFTSGELEPTYLRFLERRLRETFGFPGTPIDLSVRARQPRARQRLRGQR
jgi:GTP-binding protein